jgi:hypothetical protein
MSNEIIITVGKWFTKWNFIFLHENPLREASQSNQHAARMLCLIPIIPATQDMEIRRITFQGQPVSKEISKTPTHTSKNRLVKVGHKCGSNCTEDVGGGS